MPRVLVAAAIVSTLLAACITARPDPGTNIAEEGQEAQGKASRIGPELLALAESRQQEGEATDRSESGLAKAPLPVRDGRVLVDCTADGDPEALATALADLGMIEPATFQRVVSGWLPIESIERLGDLESLRFARASGAQTHEPSKTSSPAGEPHAGRLP